MTTTTEAVPQAGETWILDDDEPVEILVGPDTCDRYAVRVVANGDLSVRSRWYLTPAPPKPPTIEQIVLDYFEERTVPYIPIYGGVGNSLTPHTVAATIARRVRIHYPDLA